MPRLRVTANCSALVTEKWIVDITADQYAALLADEATRQLSGENATDENLRDELIEIGAYVSVENVRVEGEYDREITGFKLIADDSTDTPETALDTAAATLLLFNALSALVTDEHVVMGEAARQQAARARVAYVLAFPGDPVPLRDVAPDGVLG